MPPSEFARRQGCGGGFGGAAELEGVWEEAYGREVGDVGGAEPRVWRAWALSRCIRVKLGVAVGVAVLFMSQVLTLYFRPLLRAARSTPVSYQ